ncbi:MAG: hypothetical protein FJ404_06635 [Verrucomicrobia bacterium]|nr:hypothetical protein [Verrucomicrobiota bacterium]
MHPPFHEGRSTLEAVHFGLAFYGIVALLIGMLTTSTAVAVIGFGMIFVGLVFFFLNNLFQED